MPSLWRSGCAEPEVLDRRAIHAQLSRWLDDDHHAKHKSWSWTLVGGDDGPRELQVGLLDDGLAARLLAGADRTRRSRCPIPGLGSGDSFQQVAAVSWAQLAAPAGARAWTVRFVSPVTFRRGNKFLPWPSPEAVFGSLRTTWRTYAPPSVGEIDLDLRLDPLIVAAIDGASVVERVELRAAEQGGEPRKVTVGGFLGAVRYALDGAADARVVDGLMRLAVFSGVGAYTTRGFGGVQLVAR